MQCQLVPGCDSQDRFEGRIRSDSRPPGRLQTRSFLCLLPQCGPRHPQVVQRKQRVQLHSVLEQPADAPLHLTELAFNHPTRVFDLATDARCNLFQVVQGCAPRRPSVHHFVLVRSHRHVAVDVLGLCSLAHSLVSHACKNIGFFSKHQCVRLCRVFDVGLCPHQVGHQTRVRIDPEVSLQSKVPLVASCSDVSQCLVLSCCSWSSSARQ